jgi:hypothetical protein
MFQGITGEVKQYPYRTAMVSDRFLRLDRNSDDARDFEEKLAAAANVRPDNHTVYTITQEGKIVYVMCSDFTIIFGWTLVERRW